MNTIPYFNKKIRNILAISIRNLFYDNGDDEIVSPSKPRKNTMFQLMEYSGDYSEFSKLNQQRLLSSFVSLHYITGELLYISEVIPDSLNPNYSSFSLANTKRNNSEAIIIKVWTIYQHDWKLLIQWNCNLHKLTYIDTQLDALTDNFNDNTILIRIGNRYYTDKTNMINFEFKQIETNQSQVDSYTFDTVRSINNLDKSLQELRISKIILSKQITDILNTVDHDNHNYDTILNEIHRLELNIEQLNKQINKEKSNNDKVLSEIMKLKITNNTLSQITETNQAGFEINCKNEIEYLNNQVPILRDSMSSINNSIKSQLSQFIDILNDVIPINKQTSLYNLSILGIEFPSSIKDLLNLLYYGEADLENEYLEVMDHNTKILLVNTALNYMIQLMLVFIKLSKLPVYYPIQFKGNLSTIKDFKENEFPLYYEKSHTKRGNRYVNGSNVVVLSNIEFEKGISLFNKNLLLILYHISDYYHHDLFNDIPIYCLDNFLWILQYLILFLTANNNETE